MEVSVLDSQPPHLVLTLTNPGFICRPFVLVWEELAVYLLNATHDYVDHFHITRDF